ncbi:MAG TPA: MBL fold metallo-hydrolase [Steroidobacteraceae bacterium]|jgi:glyoxylase-like metal-dependent hydrolase (beta-lactamase superfamily II)
MDRRTILQGTLSGLIGMSLAPLARAVATQGPTLTPLNGKLAVVSGAKDNVVALSTDDGLLLVDSGSPGATGALLAQLRRLPGGGHVRTLINTHYHADQTGGNEVLGKAGAAIIAHAKTKQWLVTEHYNPENDAYIKAQPKAAWPTQVFYSTGAMTAGAEHIEYGHLVSAHTEGDCYVHFRDSNVLAVGHVASPAADPELDWFAGGWLGGRLDALALLQKLADDKTQIVPAFGPIISRGELKAEFDLLQTVYTRMIDDLRNGYSAQDMLQAGVLNGLARTWTDPKKFVFDAFKGLWGYQDAIAPNIV